GGADAARPPDRGRRPRARARGDLQGAGRGPGAELPAAPAKGGLMGGKTVVRTEAAPAPFQGAPYSQAIVAGGLVFVSGQLGLHPGDTEIGGGIEEQTERVFANLRAILEEAGSGLDRVGQTTGLLRDPGDFGAVDEGG